MGRLLCAVLILLLPWGTSSLAQDASDLVNFAFASRLGSGVYQTSGRTLWILRIPGSATVLRREETRAWSMKVVFPFTIGLFDFKPADVIESGLPSRFDTLGLTPGIRFEVPTTPAWTLFPFAQGGPVRDFSTDTTAWVYSVGVTSEATLPRRELEWIVRSELAWSGMNPQGEGLQETFGELIHGVEIWGPLPAHLGDARLVIGGFAAGYLFWGRARFVEESDFRPQVYAVQWEAGVVLSTRPRTHLWKIRVPDVGLSYRWGDRFSSIRLVFGRTF